MLRGEVRTGKCGLVVSSLALVSECRRESRCGRVEFGHTGQVSNRPEHVDDLLIFGTGRMSGIDGCLHGGITGLPPHQGRRP